MPRAKRASNGTAPGYRVHFWCPGCQRVHGIVTDTPESWTFNGDYDLPTFTPSVLVHNRWHEPPVTAENLEQWHREPWEQRQVDIVCHSFVTEGRIQFLADSTHELAGQTVDLPEWPMGQPS